MSPNRYTLALLTALLALASAVPARSQTDYGTGVSVEVPKATGAITLDGDPSEADWASATIVNLTANWNGGYYEGYGDPAAADVAVTGRLLWSDTTLFVFVRHEDFQTLFFGNGEPYNGEQVLIGVDLTHTDDDTTDATYGGWPDNAPNLGATTYKISPEAGITSNWGFNDISPVDSGYVAGETYVDSTAFEWGVEMAIYGSEIAMGAQIGFNAGGGTGDAAAAADTAVTGGDGVYGYYSWQVAASGGSAGGDVMNNSASFATLELVMAVANEGGPSGSENALFQRGANPFRGSTNFAYRLSQSGQVELAAYDMLGRRVATLDAGARTAGEHPARFDAAGLRSGTYLVRLSIDGAHVATRRVTHLQ